MKIFPTSVIKKIDADTIRMEPVSSIELMERSPTSCCAITTAITPPLPYLRAREITAATPLRWPDCSFKRGAGWLFGYAPQSTNYRPTAP